MRILITGLNSVIGWHCFLGAGKHFNVLGTYRRGNRLFPKERTVRADLDSRDEVRQLFSTFQPTHVVHARSICDLDVCESLPALTERINVAGTEIFLEEAERAGCVRRFCYISTDHVFDGERGWYTESDTPKPKHVYGRSKLKAEEIVRASKLSW